MKYEEYLNVIKAMIDELKSMSTQLGLSNTGDEYRIISDLFTYKFLNEKLVNDYKKRTDQSLSFDNLLN